MQHRSWRVLAPLAAMVLWQLYGHGGAGVRDHPDSAVARMCWARDQVERIVAVTARTGPGRTTLTPAESPPARWESSSVPASTGGGPAGRGCVAFPADTRHRDAA